MAIITYPLNGIEYSAEDAETYLCTRTSGVYASDDHFSATITDARTITIGTGLAWIKNGDFAGKSIINNEEIDVEIEIANAGLPRIDRIVLQFDSLLNASQIVAKTGTPSVTPVAPAVERTAMTYELGLYTVYVGAASVSISAADITDTRADETVCGLMRDGVTGIPAEQMLNQLEAQFNDWFDEMKGGLDGDAAISLQNQIIEINGNISQINSRDYIVFQDYFASGTEGVDRLVGFYRCWKNGTLELWMKKTISTTVVNPSNNVYTSGALAASNITFPIPFLEPPFLDVGVSSTSIAMGDVMPPGNRPGLTETSTGEYMIWRPTMASTAYIYVIEYHAVGKYDTETYNFEGN